MIFRGLFGFWVQDKLPHGESRAEKTEVSIGIQMRDCGLSLDAAWK
jgi:hypothetical protein